MTQIYLHIIMHSLNRRVKTKQKEQKKRKTQIKS